MIGIACRVKIICRKGRKSPRYTYKGISLSTLIFYIVNPICIANLFFATTLCSHTLHAYASPVPLRM